MIKTFFMGLLCLIIICFSSSTAYSHLKNHYSSNKSLEYIKQEVDSKYGEENVDCIIEATYFEARGEEEIGHKAIVEVIYNRYNSGRFPDNFCDVVHQNKQFSYRNGERKYNLHYNDLKVKGEITETVYRHLYAITKDRCTGVLPECVSHYDGKSFNKPKWAFSMNMVKEIGNHQFYCHRG